jgi:hypothetical protein
MVSTADSNTDSNTERLRAEEVCQHSDTNLGKPLLPPLTEDVPREKPGKR